MGPTFFKCFLLLLRSVCLFVCPLAYTAFPKSHMQPNFAKLLVNVACCRGSASDGDVAICCVLPLLMMTSCFHSTESMGQNQARRCISKKFARWRIAVRKRLAATGELTCHMGSRSGTCHPAEVTFPALRLPQPIKAGTRFIDTERMKG